jgi:hypothetical protein
MTMVHLTVYDAFGGIMLEGDIQLDENEAALMEGNRFRVERMYPNGALRWSIGFSEAQSTDE